jgi:hypothetical protein
MNASDSRSLRLHPVILDACPAAFLPTLLRGADAPPAGPGFYRTHPLARWLVWPAFNFTAVPQPSFHNLLMAGSRVQASRASLRQIRDLATNLLRTLDRLDARFA